MDDDDRRRKADMAVYRVLRAEQDRDRRTNETLPASAVGERRPREARYLQELMRYAVPVLTDLVDSGRIFRILAERGWHVTYVAPLGVGTEEFVQEWLELGWESFVNGVRDDRWDPERASLTTYFITLCIGRFKRHYRRWWSDQDREVLVKPVDVDEIVPLEGSEELDRLGALAWLPRRIVEERAVQGAPFPEIAETLGIRVERVRAIYRDAIRSLRIDDEGIRDEL